MRNMTSNDYDLNPAPTAPTRLARVLRIRLIVDRSFIAHELVLWCIRHVGLTSTSTWRPSIVRSTNRQRVCKAGRMMTSNDQYLNPPTTATTKLARLLRIRSIVVRFFMHYRTCLVDQYFDVASKECTFVQPSACEQDWSDDVDLASNEKGDDSGDDTGDDNTRERDDTGDHTVDDTRLVSSLVWFPDNNRDETGDHTGDNTGDHTGHHTGNDTGDDTEEVYVYAVRQVYSRQFTVWIIGLHLFTRVTQGTLLSYARNRRRNHFCIRSNR